MPYDTPPPSIAKHDDPAVLSTQCKSQHNGLKVELLTTREKELISVWHREDRSDASSPLLPGLTGPLPRSSERKGHNRLSRVISAFNNGNVDGMREQFNLENLDDIPEHDDDELFSCESAGCVWPCSHHEHFAKEPDFIWTSVDYWSILQDTDLCKEMRECGYCQTFIAIGRSWCTCYKNYRRQNVTKTEPCRHEAFHARFYNGLLTQLEGTWSCWKGSDKLEVSTDCPKTTRLPLRNFDGAYHKDLTGPNCASMFRRWIEECDNGHRRCVSEADGLRPRRVIQCLSADSVRLLDIEPRWRGKYIALSYCWGGASPPSTYKDNLGSRKHSLQWRFLPPLYQDLIVLAQNLGIDYVWIDSLCIVQDDSEEKELEIPRMGDIFLNACFVVIAAAALSPQKRLFRGVGARDEKEEHRRMWKNLGLTELRFRKRFHSLRFSGFTDKRIWTYQERLLARRCLIFYDSEVVWECRTECRCECSGAQSLLNPKDAFHSELLPWISSCESRQAPRHFANAADAYAFWRKAVRTFSSRKTKYEKDRLPAISALARAIEEATADEYLAGLWRNDLPAQLFWSCEDNFGDGSSARLGPSWSWVSANATASYLEVGSLGEIATVEVIGARCEPAGKNRFGTVLAGNLILCGVHCFSDVRIAKARHPKYPDTQTAFIELYLEDGRFQFAESPHAEFTFLDGYRVCAVDMVIGSAFGEQNLKTIQRVMGARPAEQATCSGAVRLLWVAEDVMLILAYCRTADGCFERLGILFGDAVPAMPDLAPSCIEIV